ncbi:MAG TPA: DUF1990 domain-containing protein [Pirellulaceae bacterium]|nr:DUF1990 domain-containing protein [Pirellulaceae bacterium]
MFTLRQPTEQRIRDYLSAQVSQAFSYDDVGCTRGEPAAKRGWNIDRQRVLLGRGREVFEAAKQAISNWRMFPQEVARVCWPEPPQTGLVVGVLYKVWLLPVWILFPARVVWVMDEQVGEIHRFGFAYGTLPDHPERGEERFVVEWNDADDSVWYDLLAVSQPTHWLARIGYPYTRYEQARFRRLSAAAMRK